MKGDRLRSKSAANEVSDSKTLVEGQVRSNKGEGPGNRALQFSG